MVDAFLAVRLMRARMLMEARKNKIVSLIECHWRKLTKRQPIVTSGSGARRTAGQFLIMRSSADRADTKCNTIQALLFRFR